MILVYTGLFVTGLGPVWVRVGQFTTLLILLLTPLTQIEKVHVESTGVRQTQPNSVESSRLCQILAQNSGGVHRIMWGSVKSSDKRGRS
jgi:hypothetical protein